MKRKLLTLRKRKKIVNLTPMQKVEIRAAINARRYLSTKALAKRFNVSCVTIYRLGFDRNPN
jgi:hypothetical protein